MGEAATQAASPKAIFVKWATPADEALSTMRLAQALVARRVARPSQVAVAAPNRTWAINLLQAATKAEAPASLCIAQEKTDRVHSVLAALEQLESSQLQGRTLAHRVGADATPELAHALTHLHGDEDARTLAALLCNQLERPSVHDRTDRIPIMLSDDLRSTPEHLFVVGCVDGLLPSTHALDENDSGNTEPLAAERSRFSFLAGAGSVRTTLSYFAKAHDALAASAHLRVARYKNEDGRRMAMTKPCLFWAEMGQERPSTTGGQALLRTFGLN